MTSAFSLLAEKKGMKSELPTLTYYYFDGWMLCNKITVIVNDLKKTHGDKVKFQTFKVSAPGSKEAIKEAKLTNHGIVCKDVKGKIITTVDGHNYKKDKVVAAMNKLLGK